MSAQATGPAAPKGAVIAERLLAHARLCEQIARECRNEETADKLRRMAHDCAQAAAQLAPHADPIPRSRH
jgi:glycerol-3-phosphate O-acyltransferase